MTVAKTQGTELFFINTLATAATVVKFTCPTGISGLGGKADQIDTTCLDDTEKTFERGLGNPGEVSVPFNLHVDNEGHQFLFDLLNDGRTLDWLICLSDGDDAPTVGSAETFIVPTDRTSFEFRAYIADLNIDAAGNNIVKGTLSLQRSGVVTPHWVAA